MAQAVSHWPLTQKARVRALVNPCFGQTGTGTGFTPTSLYPVPCILLHIHLSPPHEVCDSPDQAAHYHTLGSKLGGFISDTTLGWNRGKTYYYTLDAESTFIT
jgi:hypothetical protein